MSNNAITPFAFGENLVRTTADEHGNPWFVAKDVCRVLEIEWKGSGTIGPLDEDERGSVTVDTPGGEQQMLTISESGLYALIFRSRKPEAKAFRKWVTSEVLPAIRKTGVYSMPGASSHFSRGSLLLHMSDLPEDVQAMRPKLRDRCLNYALQAARVIGVTDMNTVNALFINYCRILYTDARLDALHPQQVYVNGEHKIIHDFIAECLTPARGKRLRYSNIKTSFQRWCGRRGIQEIPSDRSVGGILRTYFNYIRSNGMLYNDVAFTQQGLV